MLRKLKFESKNRKRILALAACFLIAALISIPTFQQTAKAAPDVINWSDISTSIQPALSQVYPNFTIVIDLSNAVLGSSTENLDIVITDSIQSYGWRLTFHNDTNQILLTDSSNGNPINTMNGIPSTLTLSFNNSQLYFNSEVFSDTNVSPSLASINAANPITLLFGNAWDASSGSIQITINIPPPPVPPTLNGRESLYIWIDPNQGGGYITNELLPYSLPAFNMTVDTSNATYQNDYCAIYLTDILQENGITWGTGSNNQGYYGQYVTVFNATDTIPEIDANTSTLAPVFLWDGSTLLWYGNGTNDLIASINTASYFSAPMSYISATFSFNSGSVNVTFNNPYSPYSSPSPTPTATPYQGSNGGGTSKATPTPKASPTATPLPVWEKWVNSNIDAVVVVGAIAVGATLYFGNHKRR